MIKKFNDVLFKLTGPACCGGGTRFPGPEGGLALGGARLCCCPGAGGLALTLFGLSGRLPYSVPGRDTDFWPQNEPPTDQEKAV